MRRVPQCATAGPNALDFNLQIVSFKKKFKRNV